MRSAFCWVVAATILGAPGVSSAGRTQYGWLFGTEVMPERGAEIQTWIDEQNGLEPVDGRWTRWGWSGLIGVTDQLTLALPVEFLWRDSDASEPSFTWERYGIEARYRLVSQDPVDAPPFAPLVRLGVFRNVIQRDAVEVEADLVGSTTTPSGAVMALVDLGVHVSITPDETEIELRPGAGVSFRLVGDLRGGAEVFGEIDTKTAERRWIAAGPNLAWSHGRFWISAAFGIGLYQITTAPRVQWGIMF